MVPKLHCHCTLLSCQWKWLEALCPHQNYPYALPVQVKWRRIVGGLWQEVGRTKEQEGGMILVAVMYTESYPPFLLSYPPILLAHTSKIAGMRRPIAD